MTAEGEYFDFSTVRAGGGAIDVTNADQPAPGIMGHEARLRMDVPLGWRSIGDDTYLIQTRPRATAQLGPVIAAPSDFVAAADELFAHALPAGTRAVVSGDAVTTTLAGAALRLLSVDVLDGRALIERRWGAFIEEAGRAAVLYVRCAGALSDPIELFEAALSARIGDAAAPANPGWLTFWSS